MWWCSGGGSRNCGAKTLFRYLLAWLMGLWAVLLRSLVPGNHVWVEHWHSHGHGIGGEMEEDWAFYQKLCQPLPKGNGANGAKNEHRTWYFNKNISKTSTYQEHGRMRTWRCQLLSQECVRVRAPRCQLLPRACSRVPSKMSTSQEQVRSSKMSSS
jgi:hypothetical protein